MLFAGTLADFSGLGQLHSLLALFLAGLLLAAVHDYAGHIGYCIGIHAGWVSVIKPTRHLTDDNQHASYAFLARGYDGVISNLAALWLSLLLLAGWILTRWRNWRVSERENPH